MRLEYEEATDHAYLYLTENATDGVDEHFSFSDEELQPLWGVHLDLDVNGRLVGIEFERASQLLPPDLLAGAKRI
jgi:uncharacterized protein YuzE